MEACAERRALQRQARAHACVRDSWQRLQALEEVTIEDFDPLPAVQPLSRHRQRERQRSIGANAKIDLRAVPETVDRQSGASERGDCQREFDDDE